MIPYQDTYTALMDAEDGQYSLWFVEEADGTDDEYSSSESESWYFYTLDEAIDFFNEKEPSVEYDGNGLISRVESYTYLTIWEHTPDGDFKPLDYYKEPDMDTVDIHQEVEDKLFDIYAVIRDYASKDSRIEVNISYSGLSWETAYITIEIQDEDIWESYKVRVSGHHNPESVASSDASFDLRDYWDWDKLASDVLDEVFHLKILKEIPFL